MSYQLISESKPKARKVHSCIWCREKIAIGEAYIHEFSRFDGDTQNHHWHPECREASARYLHEETDTGEFEAHAYKRGTIDYY